MHVDELADLARDLIRNGERRILGITGPPGAGKSTVATALTDRLGPDTAVVVGMDGFHLANAELIRIGRRGRKGAPDTFDVGGYVALLQRLRNRSEQVVHAPVFDRGLEEPIGSAVAVPSDTPLVITEGNYLLLDTDGWQRVRPCLDQVWYVDVPDEERTRRLVARRMSYGEATPDAERWVRSVDGPNAAAVETTASRADLRISSVRVD